MEKMNQNEKRKVYKAVGGLVIALAGVLLGYHADNLPLPTRSPKVQSYLELRKDLERSHSGQRAVVSLNSLTNTPGFYNELGCYETAIASHAQESKQDTRGGSFLFGAGLTFFLSQLLKKDEGNAKEDQDSEMKKSEGA